VGEPRTGLSITILEHLVSYFLTPPCLLHSCGGFFYLDLIFNPNYSSGMIDPSKVNICIELDRISILGNDWIFCYIDNKKDCDIQFAPDFEGCTREDGIVFSNYMLAEGLDRIGNAFCSSAVTKRWIKSRRASKFRSKPRPSTIKKLTDNYEKFKTKYTTI